MSARLAAPHISLLLLAFVVAGVHLGPLAFDGERNLGAGIHNSPGVEDDTFNPKIEEEMKTNDQHGVVDLSALYNSLES